MGRRRKRDPEKDRILVFVIKIIFLPIFLIAWLLGFFNKKK